MPCGEDGACLGGGVRPELMGMDFKSTRAHLRCGLLGPCGEDGLLRSKVRHELLWMRFKSFRLHLQCELLVPCGEDGAMNPWGWTSNPLEFICNVPCGEEGACPILHNLAKPCPI